MDKKQDKETRRVNRKINQRKGAIYRCGLVKKATKHELILKETLEELGIAFDFQKVYYSDKKCFILDFYLKTKSGRYGIEIDGKSHNSKRAKKYDWERSDWIGRRRKTTIIRFKNEQVDNDLNGIIAQILLLEPYKWDESPEQPKENSLDRHLKYRGRRLV